MKNYLKLSALAAVLVATATYATAVPITLTSGVNTTNYNGYTAGSGGNSNDINPLFNGIDFAQAANSSTMSIGTGGGIWLNPIGPLSVPPSTVQSSWITATSLGDTSPGNVVVANGYYEFSSSFTTAGGTYTGTLAVMADDTVGVFLNGTEIVDPGVIGLDGHCSVAAPNCGMVDSFAFGSATPGFISNGSNTLTFLVEQTGHAAMGLDYEVNIDNGVGVNQQTPEPSSLILLGTGLVGAAGTMFRRMRR